MENNLLNNYQGTNWSGSGELWLDPGGDKADTYDCKLQIENDSLKYTWIYEGEIKNGCFTFNENGATWVDDWHQPEPVDCIEVPDTWGLFTVRHTYDVPSNPSWGWQSKLTERPDGSLILQMTNIALWGEEGRAVRMIFSLVKS